MKINQGPLFKLKGMNSQVWWLTSVISILGRLRQEDAAWGPSLGYSVRLCLQNKQTNKIEYYVVTWSFQETFVNIALFNLLRCELGSTWYRKGNQGLRRHSTFPRFLSCRISTLGAWLRGSYFPLSHFLLATSNPRPDLPQSFELSYWTGSHFWDLSLTTLGVGPVRN